ncbi:MAG TPA: polyhydroxyalkanoic acid system family protein [Thermoanaerobaculia bacterium]|nr:polyhydroxyalkanoic acid system family protein [Thermoanaerobaculia bacterium]
MKISFPHGTTPANARKKIDTLLDRLHDRHGENLEVMDRTWAGDTLNFDFKARGFHARGSVDVGDKEIRLEGKVPLVARPFEGKIKNAIEKEASKIFSKMKKK